MADELVDILRVQVRFRVFVDGDLKLEEWVENPLEAESAMDRHAALCAEADETWLVEIFDPIAAPAHQYVRFGTDKSMMVAPVMLSTDPSSN